MSEKKVKKEAPAISWRVAADRNVYGERVELKSLPGYWVQPRRLSKGAEADRMAGVIPEEVKERILVAMTENMDAETVGQIEAKVAKVAHGVHAHNFNGEPEGGSVEWARSLLEYSAIFDEIIGIVEEKNLPL